MWGNDERQSMNRFDLRLGAIYQFLGRFFCIKANPRNSQLCAPDRKGRPGLRIRWVQFGHAFARMLMSDHYASLNSFRREAIDVSRAGGAQWIRIVGLWARLAFPSIVRIAESSPWKDLCFGHGVLRPVARFVIYQSDFRRVRSRWTRT